MGFAEDKFFDYLRRNPNLMTCINVDDMLNQLRAVFTLSVAEQLERDLDRRGNLRTVNNFLLELRKRDDWVNNLLRALWECEHRELFKTLQAEYRLHRPKRVWEPSSCSLSPPPPYNDYDLPQPDVQQRYASLPLQVNPNMPQPCAPVAPSPGPVRPDEASRLSHQPQDSSNPSTISRIPTLQSHLSAPASAHPVSLPDLVDTCKPGDDISKTPIPESTLFQPAPLSVSESNGLLREGTNPSERHLSEPCFPPAKEDNTTTQPLQNQEVVLPVEQGVSVVNSPGKYSSNELPHTSVYPEVAERDPPSPPNSFTSSIHRVNNASMAPLQRDLPSYIQGKPNPPVSQFSDASDISQNPSVESDQNLVTSSPSYHLPAVSSGSGASAGAGQQRREQSTYQLGTPNPPASQFSVESAPNLVTSSPSQHLPEVSSGSEAYAGAVQQRREQSTHQPNEHRSSCRPTDDDRNWSVGKPGVLMSTAFAAVPGEASECPPLSRIPILEISYDESSHGHPQPSGSSQSPKTSKGSSPPLGGTTSTPKTTNSWSSPKKSPEENEEPRGASSSFYGRTNVALLQEPEENSFELSRDLESYRLQFNEDPSVDLMAENSVPRHRTMNSSGTSDKSDRETFQENDRPRENNLHNPLVITLSATVVCLALYIIWLKHKN